MRVLFIVLLSILFCSNLFAQQYQWVKGGGTTDDISPPYTKEGSYYMCTDQNKNIYSLNVIGSHTAMTADTFTHGSTPFVVSNNILITSYNCNGVMRWAKLITCSGYDVHPLGLVVDRIGHLYLSGIFWHASGTFSIGYDTTIATSNLVAGTIQLDTNGHFNWIRWVGPNTVANRTASSPGYGTLALDNQQNVHFIKVLRSGSQITPSVLSTYGTYDITYDATGTLLSAVRLQLDSLQAIQGACFDSSSNTMFTYGDANELLVSSGNYPTFAAAFDANRNVLWKDTLTSPYFGSSGLGSAFNGIATDNSGHLYLCGSASVSGAYGGDTVTNAPFGLGSIGIVLKTDTLGHPIWLKPFASSLSICGFSSVAVMPNNKITASGAMVGTVISGNDTLVNYSGESENAFFTILDTSGNIQTLQQIHGNGNPDISMCLASDKVGNLYLGGYVASSIWGGSMTPYTSVGGNTDFFVMKYGVDCNCTSMPMAAFTYSGSPTVTFNYTGTTAGVDSVRWYFGDGGTAITFSPTHTYTAAGVYHVTVRIYSACGNDVRFATITIPCVGLPVCSFTYSGTTATRNFTYTGTPATPDSVAWTFGDGGHATGLSVSHTYLTAGTFNVCATVYTPCGNHTICNSVTITCASAPIASFTNSGAPTTTFTYSGTTTGLDSVVWHYGDGGHGTGTTSVHSYTLGGSYVACAIAYNHCGWDSACATITVPCVPPVANFSHAGTLVQNFSYTGTTPGIDSIVWDYGDGNTGHGSASTHTYAIEGTYHVCVMAYSYCAADTQCSDIVITCPPPVAAITNTNDTFHYTGTTPTIDSIVWNFGDGFTDTGMSPVHPYAVTDTYHVCVRVYGYCGADTLCTDVIVTGVGISTITLSDISVYPNPATNQVNIERVTSLMNYRLMSVTGSVLQSGPLNVGKNRLDMSNYSPGVYMIELISGNGSRKTFRIIKE